MGDDGVGLAALERLQQDWDFLHRLTSLMEHLGPEPAPVIEAAEHVILLDAIDVGSAPGAEVVLPRRAAYPARDQGITSSGWPA
jgi:hydrogenase maturation protease